MEKPVLKIIGTDGNAFALLSKARRATRENMDWETIQKEAMSSDYDHLLKTLMKHFEIE